MLHTTYFYAVLRIAFTKTLTPFPSPSGRGARGEGAQLVHLRFHPLLIRNPDRLGVLGALAVPTPGSVHLRSLAVSSFPDSRAFAVPSFPDQRSSAFISGSIPPDSLGVLGALAVPTPGGVHHHARLVAGLRSLAVSSFPDSRAFAVPSLPDQRPSAFISGFIPLDSLGVRGGDPDGTAPERRRNPGFPWRENTIAL